MTENREKKNIVLGITGSIAAYKAAELARLFIKRGYSVVIAMTQSAQEFITPLTMETITGRAVLGDLFDFNEEGGIGHIQVADWADAIVIAPATANVIAKLAHGMADCAVTTVALATKAPIVVCPAMNVNMFDNPVTQANIQILRERGITVIDPDAGELACGWQGSGRLVSPWEVFQQTRRALSVGDFNGKKILITTGPTREPIDPVRYISNRSSGKMGSALAREAFRRGAEVTVVHGPVKIKAPAEIKKVSVLSASGMQKAVKEQMANPDTCPDIVIMAAAVADFRPEKFSEIKIKKENLDSKISLIENPDILAELGAEKKDKRPILVGFAIETGELDDLLSYVRNKLEKKNADIIVGNFANDALELDTNRVWIISKNGRQDEVATMFKSRVANKILDAILKV